MKYFIYVLLLTILVANPKILLSQQDNAENKYSIQLNFGLSRTLDYDLPFNLAACDEPCIPEEQKAKVTETLDFNLYRDFNKRNSLKIGIGISSYRYSESGQSDDGSGSSFSPYEFNLTFNFYALSIGHRYTLNPEKKVRLFIEYDFMYEIPTEDDGLVKSGLAIQPKVGALYSINSKWSVIVEGLYKSALTDYSDQDFQNDYKPNAYGMQAGIILKI